MAKSRTPKEAAEGILVGPNKKHPDLVVAVSEIEVMDLLSEGPIEGLVEGEYIYSGTKGNVGWDSVTYNPYPDPPDAIGFKWLRSMYWNEVPVVNSANKYNYQRIDVTKTEGVANGAILNSSNPDLTITRSINERLRFSELVANGEPKATNKDFTKIYRIINKECKGAIVNVKVPQLLMTDKKNGDTKITALSYKIFYKPIFTDIKKTFTGSGVGINGYYGPVTETIEGKIQGAYVRSTKILFNLDSVASKDFLGWEIKIQRTTADSVTVYLRNQTFIDSITEIYNNTFLYPGCAIIRARFSAEFFQNIPQRSYDCKLLKVKVPSNYDPIRKTYSRMHPNYEWDGTFKEALEWTDNPAWCFYDICTNRRYGLGEYINRTSLNKWELYQIAKYCDTLVDDGYGGVEPQFTCNLIIFQKDEAYQLLNNLASIFNTMLYYANGEIRLSQDSPKETKMFFTNTDVEEGDFNYTSSARKDRHTVAVTHYNDPQNFFKPAAEYVEDLEGIRRYGIRQVELPTYGCTSRGQANRLGRWILQSENLEKETVTFIAGQNASYLRPGDIFGIYDTNRKGNRYAGRIKSFSDNGTNSTILLDDEITLDATKNYNLILITPSYNFESSQVDNLNSDDFSNMNRAFTQTKTFAGGSISTVNGYTQIVTSSFDIINYSVPANCVWVLELDQDITTYSQYSTSFDANTDLYRAIKIVEKDGKFEVFALQYSSQKFTNISNSLTFERPPEIINAIPEGPTNLLLTVLDRTRNTKVIEYSFVPPNNTVGLTSYRVYVKSGPFANSNVPDDVYRVAEHPLSTNRGTYFPIANGSYYFRVYGYNQENNTYSSTYASNVAIIANVSPVQDVIISSLQLDNWTGAVSFGSDVKDEITNYNEEPSFVWQVGLQNNGVPPNNLYFRISFRQPSLNNIPSNLIYYDVTGLQLPEFLFEFDVNRSLPNGPFRNVDVVVEAMDDEGRTSAGNFVAPNLIENGWFNNGDGYDIIHVNNERTTGINFSGAGYSSFIDYNGGLNFLFPTGAVPTTVLGGYIFGSTGYFSSGEAFSGRADIAVRSFTYHHAERYAFAPAVFNPMTPFKTGWASIAFFDAFDVEVFNNASTISGLEFKNSIPVFTTGFIQEAIVKDRLTFPNSGYDKGYDLGVMQTGRGAFSLVSRNSDGTPVIFSSRRANL